MNSIIRNTTIENYLNLKSAFENSKKIFSSQKDGKIFHNGEYGTYREDLVKRFLRLYIPSRLDIGTGFLINAEGDISTQCDIIIYDRYTTPIIESSGNQRFFPIETVAAVGEIKSTVQSMTELSTN